MAQSRSFLRLSLLIFSVIHSEPDLSEDLFIDSESEVQHVLYVVVLCPLKGLVKLLIQILQVAQVTWTTWWEIGV